MDRHHRYNTSEKGRERQRRYNRSYAARCARRTRDLQQARARLEQNLVEVQKELDNIG